MSPSVEERLAFLEGKVSRRSTAFAPSLVDHIDRLDDKVPRQFVRLVGMQSPSALPSSEP